MISYEMSSGPLEFSKNGVGIGHSLPIVENKTIILGIIVRYIDNLGSTQLTLKFAHQLGLF